MSAQRSAWLDFWDDKELAALSPAAQYVVGFLTFSRHAELPGLVKLDVDALVKKTKRPEEEMRAAVAELRARRVISVDDEHEVILCTAALRYRLPDGPKHLYGWRNRWRMVPDSPLRYTYRIELGRALEAERQRVEAAGLALGWDLERAWSQSFGLEANAPTTRRVALTLSDTLPDTQSDRVCDTQSIPYRIGSVEVEVAVGSEIRNPDPEPPKGQASLFADPAASSSPVLAPKRARRAKASSLDVHREAAETLWSRQDAMRRDAIPGARSLRPTDETLERVADRLADGYSVEDCVHVLEVYAAAARSDPASAQWFNGVTNWRPDNFAQALGRQPGARASPSTRPVSVGRAEPSRFEAGSSTSDEEIDRLFPRREA